MSTEVQRFLTAAHALSSKERQELAVALEREGLVLAVRGKYAHVPTSSDAFMARKHPEEQGALPQSPENRAEALVSPSAQSTDLERPRYFDRKPRRS